MDLRKLKTLIDLVSESNVTELEITEAEGRVRIVKAAPAMAGQPVVYSTEQARPASPSYSPVQMELAGSPASAPVQIGHAVKSPMVGTFYRSASPGAKTIC